MSRPIRIGIITSSATERHRGCWAPKAEYVWLHSVPGVWGTRCEHADGTPNPLLRWALKHLELGEYICFLDDDNRYRPAFLTRMVEALESDPSVGIAICGVDDQRYGQRIEGFPWYGGCDNSGFLIRRNCAKTIEFPRASATRDVIQDCEFIATCADLFGWVRVPELLVTFGSAPNIPPLRGGIKLLESWEQPLKAARANSEW